MAWIKLRTDLAEDIAVISMAAALKIDRPGIVGRLHAVWSWATDQTADGNAPGVTPAFLDAHTDTPGMARAMIRQGWLEVVNGGLRFPNWERHLSQGAKARALTARRVDKTRNAPTVTGALPEQRQSREDKREPAVAGVISGGILPALPATGREALLVFKVGDPALSVLSPLVSPQEVYDAARTIRPGRKNHVGVLVSVLCEAHKVTLPRKGEKSVGDILNGRHINADFEAAQARIRRVRA